MLEYRDHFGIDDTDMRRILSDALSQGGSYGDIFFEHTIDSLIKMEEGIVKDVEKSISHGAGIRVLKGESTGYAYTEELTKEKMKRAAITAATRASTDEVSSTGRQGGMPISPPRPGSAFSKCGMAEPAVSAPTSSPMPRPRSSLHQVATSFIPGG